MLQSLFNKPPKVAQRVLVELTQELLPHPFQESNFSIDSNDLRNIVLKEIRKKSGLEDFDNSTEAKAKLLTVLSSEITSVVMDTARLKKAKERFAARGLLPFKEYSLGFSKIFKKYNNYIGVTKSLVTTAFKEVEYYYIDMHPDSNFVMFSKQFRGYENLEDFILLVKGSIRDSSIFASEAWFVFNNDFNIPDTYSVTELLIIFLKKFGVDFSLRKDENTTFYINYDIISLDNGKQFPEFYMESEYTNEDLYFSGNQRRTQVSDLHRVFNLYIIKMENYRKYLLKHGVIQ